MDYSLKTKRRYDKRLKKFGYDPKTLGWTKGKQGIRFSILTSIGNMKNSSVLDIGCGFGDLYGFLRYNKMNCKYLGLDLNPNLLEYGKMRYPNATFEVFDIEKDSFDKKYDWIIISGLLNYERKNPYEFIEFVLKKTYSFCKHGLAIDFISDYVDFKKKNINYVEPEKILKICMSITSRVVLRHDYMPFEFCVYLYRNNRSTKNNIYAEYHNSLKKELRTNQWLKNKNI